MDLSIIIVNYNTRQLTLDCLESVFASRTTYTYEVFVVDNASTDDSVPQIRKHFPQVKLLVHPDNLGFAKANNRAIKQSSGRYVLLLNSDTVVMEDTFQVMLDRMEMKPQVGAAGCKVLLPDGRLDKACRRGFPTPWASFCYAFGLAALFPQHPHINRYHLGHLDPDTAHPVDSLVGAFMLVRREATEEVGLLDETFFMYGEDLDWCYRIKQAGWEIVYDPVTTIIHYKGGSSRRRKSLKIIYEFHRAMWLFHRKHYWRQYSFVVNGLVLIGIGVKWGWALLRNAMAR